MAKNLVIDQLSEPLSGVTSAKINVYADDGNLTIDPLPGDEQLLANGTLQYFESQGRPIRTFDVNHGQATFTLKGGSSMKPWFHFPWSACNGATEWQIHLNPMVSSDISAHSGGGNVKLNLAGMAVARVSADTGGGNMDLVLPDNASNLSVIAKTGAGAITVEIGCNITGSNIINASSGAGNVVVHVPRTVPARIHATTGWGKAIVDPLFSKTGDNTYQSPDFESAANRLEITAQSGAGNVSIQAN